jgi:hypothetical protein
MGLVLPLLLWLGLASRWRHECAAVRVELWVGEGSNVHVKFCNCARECFVRCFCARLCVSRSGAFGIVKWWGRVLHHTGKRGEALLC